MMGKYEKFDPTQGKAWDQIAAEQVRVSDQDHMVRTTANYLMYSPDILPYTIRALVKRLYVPRERHYGFSSESWNLLIFVVQTGLARHREHTDLHSGAPLLAGTRAEALAVISVMARTLGKKGSYCQ